MIAITHTHTQPYGLPQTSQKPPTGVRSSVPDTPSCWLAYGGPVTDTENRRQKSPVQAAASSSSVRCETGSPRRRFASTHSSRWSPTCRRSRLSKGGKIFCFYSKLQLDSFCNVLTSTGPVYQSFFSLSALS